jgi:predicted nucleotidyltransferase
MLEGTFEEDLIGSSSAGPLCDALKNFALPHAYNHRSVLKVELTGHNTLRGLMTLLWEAITDREDRAEPGSERRTPFARYAYGRISENYRRIFEDSANRSPMRYRELQQLTDMVAGMTGSFALSLFSELKGLHIDPRSQRSFLLRRRVQGFIATRADVCHLLDKVGDVGDVAIFGGMLRGVAIGGPRSFASDVDVVVNADDEAIASCLSSTEHTRNKFGGYRIWYGKHAFDVWNLRSTWAFRAGYVGSRDRCAPCERRQGGGGLHVRGAPQLDEHHRRQGPNGRGVRPCASVEGWAVAM